MYIYVAAKTKELTGIIVDCILVSDSSKSVDICPIFKNEMSKSMFMSHLTETKEIQNIEQKAFVLLLIKRRTFSGIPGT